MSGYKKEIFQDGMGFDPKFVCNICELILREPVQAFCGHRFCKLCLEVRLREGGPMQCQQCEREDPEAVGMITQDQVFPDNGVKRDMAILTVVCVNPGCDWQGRFNEYEVHWEHCTKTPVVCSQCGKEGLLRENLPAHQQSAECQGEPVTCPAGCGLIKRRDYQEHFRRMKHELWLLQELEAMKRELEKQISRNNQLTDFRDQVAEGLAQTDETLALVERQVNELILMSTTPAGSEENNKTQIRQTVSRVNTEIPEWLDSAIRRELQKTIRAVENLKQNRQEMASTLGQLENKIGSLERTVAIKDTNLAELDQKVQSLEADSFDGTFIWRVSEFAKKHQEALNGRTISIYSPPFYTSRCGYKMCARLYPNGDGMGKGSHLSLFFVVMRGNFDPLLKWPFGQRVTFCLINQNGGEHIIDSFRPDPQSSSFKRPTSDMNIASGCPLFIPLEMLQNPKNGFLKDDTMFLKVSVDVSDLSDPISTFEERIERQS